MGRMLQADNIVVSFRKETQTRIFGKERQEILRGIDLNLAKGECLGIIGESGSGKSTLGRVLCGLLKPDSGSVQVNGTPLYSPSKQERAQVKRSISIVFQDYTSSVNPRFHIETVIREPLRAFQRGGGRVTDFDQEISRLLQRVGLNDSFKKRYPHELSGGELQRVCIARALAIQPEVIIFDEAISSLDAANQTLVMDLLIDIRKERDISYLFITHDLVAITYMCDAVLFMQDGHIVERVERLAEIKNISNPYALKLLHSVMNIDMGDQQSIKLDTD